MEEPRLIGDLLAFLDSLPASFASGPREQMAVRELALRLIDAGGIPADPARLKTLIAPLVCGDQDQQREFYDRFNEWIASRGAPKSDVRVVAKKSRRWPAVAAAILLMAGIFGGGMYYKSLFRPISGPPMPPAPGPPDDPRRDLPYSNSKNRLRGIVQAPDGPLPLRNATVWIPYGINTPQYPKLVTDAQGGFTIELKADSDNTSMRGMTARTALVLQNSAVGSVAFSPDGSKLATDTTVAAMVWDAATGKEILPYGDMGIGFVWSVSFSPDGRKLALAGQDGVAVVCDAATGKKILTLRGHTDQIKDVAFSPDGRTLATASLDLTAKLWDARTGKEVLTLRGHTRGLSGVAFSPDGRTLATASFDGTAKVWDAATGKETLTLLGHIFSGFNGGVAYSPDGRTLATASDNTATVWDAATGRKILTLRGHTGIVSGVVFSPDGRTLATASNDKTAKIWNAATGEEILTMRGHTDHVDWIVFSPDGRRLATASNDDTVRVWDLVTAQPASASGTQSSAGALPAGGLRLLVTHPDYEPAYIEHAGPDRLNIIKLGPLKAAQRVLKLIPNNPPPLRRYPRWVSFTLALLPLCAAFLAFWRQRKRDRQRTAFLDQWETHLDFEPVRVHSRSEEDELFQGGEIATLARDLRRRRPEPTYQLAIEPTVRCTAARAGLFTPVRLQRRGAREYLVLLESKGARDQQARFWSCLLDRLALREVWLDRYSFSGDPRVCEVPRTERGWLRLEEISALHPRHELWIVAGAGRFFDPTTRQPAPWVPSLARWPDRAVLSLTAGTAEDREQLEDLGFAVATASVAGLAGFNSEAAQPAKQEGPAPYPLILETDESKWLQGPPPAGEKGARELRSLDRQLRAWLGGDGYRCLLACAVYPGLAWNLTLHLALALIPAEDRENKLARLVRLPWFRHARMPQWLREIFTGKLEQEESSQVISLLKDFLERKATPEAASTPGLEFAKQEIAADLRAQDKPLTRDYVFLSFLLGRKPRLRDLEAPAWLRHLLYPDGLPVLRLRRELWLALGLLAGGLVYAGSESLAHPAQKPLPPQWVKIKPPPAKAGEPVNGLSTRALEIAAARLDQGVDEKFASSSFEQAVAFAVPQGAAKSGPARPGMIFTPIAAGTPPSLVERVTEGGLIMIESFEGRLSRIFRATNELAGSFNEITEGKRSTEIPLDLASARWSPDTGGASLGADCVPLNPSERSFGSVATPAGMGMRLMSASNTAQCCKCIRRVASFPLPATVKNNGAQLQGWFSASRVASDPYSLASFQVDLSSRKKVVGSAVFAAEHRANNNCSGQPGKEVIVKSDAPFSIVLRSISNWQEIDEITIYMQGYACVSGTNTVTLSNLKVVVEPARAAGQ